VLFRELVLTRCVIGLGLFKPSRQQHCCRLQAWPVSLWKAYLTALRQTKMVFTSDDRILIKALRIEKGYGAKRLLNEFPSKPWSLSAVNKLMVKIDATGSVSRKVGSGRPFSTCTNDNSAIVADLVLSQEQNPGTHRTIREIEKETSIPRSSVHRIIHKQLSLKCFKKKQAQERSRARYRVACQAWPLRRAPLWCGKLCRIFIFQDMPTKIGGNVSNWQT
jgi:hypothetical protein